MGLRKEMACLFLLLLMLLKLGNSPCFADGYGRFSRSKGGSGSDLSPLKTHNGLKGKGNKHEDDDIFGGDKRRVYTGPNPLHNR
ncbi:unnamed protein product [Ilex paraguariensis]|uniref:Uncharacterized protein n=1 Tax=Ilex paraguariensis TaxID=185542 RepID=A0ABC8V5B0_9AQUA